MDEKEIHSQMGQVIDLYKQDIATIRTGRATPALIEDITVTVYNGEQRMSLKELGTISAPDARSLTLQPWDKTIINEIKNEIAAQNLGFNPAINGEIIRISLPPLTAEQRQDYLKLLGRKTEGARVIIRDIRSEARHGLQERQKEKEISEDEFHQLEKTLQKITDENIERIEEINQAKEKEIKGET
ncbi:ribosome recycling factor [Candidatus Shapirobacteria bacterium]|nr:ribosome recycling factor [Candidatus Shapirobacteria bacterium]